MTTFILVPGAGGAAWLWHRVGPRLREAGHEAIAVELPADDPKAGLGTYADRVVAAIGGSTGVVLVAQSLAGFTAPLVCERVAVGALVLVNAMIPVPDETAGAWWKNTGSTAARIEAARRGGYSVEFDDDVYFLHDVPADVIASAPPEREQATEMMAEPCRFEGWPAAPIHVIAGRDDRFFPVDFQRSVARERLGLEVEVVPGGHLCVLSQPAALVERLLRYAGTP